MKVVELFAGVGGFRLAAEKSNNDFEFIWVNQWEPSTKKQFAFECYEQNFGHNPIQHINEDISIAKHNIPKEFDLLVGGFPCQDYSVATTNAKGIQGIKGVLWWEIHWILQNRKPKFVLLENVDRLLKSPVSQRGRDFAIMLKCFHDEGYNVEWMVNNGSDFGFIQRRKRVFIYAYLNKNKKEHSLFKECFDFELDNNIIKRNINKFKDVKKLSDKYNDGKFLEYGFMDANGDIETCKYISKYYGCHKYLKDIIDHSADKKYFLTKEQKQKMEFNRSSKRIERLKPNGSIYYYTEGKMNFYDDINKKSRTMLTSEGTVNRSSHIINSMNKPRFLTPLECERLNGFYDNWTSSLTDRQRYFCMGNALNVDLVAQMMKKIKS